MRLLIVGAGGHGRSIAEAARMSGQYELAGFVDDSLAPSSHVMGVPVLGPGDLLVHYRDQADMAITAIGNNRVREEFHARLHAAGFELATIVHLGAIVSPSATIGPGCAIMAGAIIGTEAWLGEGVIVNCGAVADHHCRVEDFGHLGVNACMAGGAVLGRGAWMQAGAVLGYGVRIDAGLVLEPGQAVSETRSQNAIQ
jgi:sugar O-acyltransferase (sialic acid O-acetyltransferase NeuD family)